MVFEKENPDPSVQCHMKLIAHQKATRPANSSNKLKLVGIQTPLILGFEKDFSCHCTSKGNQKAIRPHKSSSN